MNRFLVRWLTASHRVSHSFLIIGVQTPLAFRLPCLVVHSLYLSATCSLVLLFSFSFSFSDRTLGMLFLGLINILFLCVVSFSVAVATFDTFLFVVRCSTRVAILSSDHYHRCRLFLSCTSLDECFSLVVGPFVLLSPSSALLSQTTEKLPLFLRGGAGKGVAWF